MKQEKNKLKIPNGYFTQLTDKIWKKIQQNEVYEELLSISSFVAQHLKKANLFKIPENYFKVLPEQVQSKIEVKTLRMTSLKREWIFALSAASVLVLFMLSVLIIQPHHLKVPYADNTVQVDEKAIFTVLSTEQDLATLETEVLKDKEVLLAVTQSIEKHNNLPKTVLEKETELDKNLETELEKALEDELDNL